MKVGVGDVVWVLMNEWKWLLLCGIGLKGEVGKKLMSISSMC